MDPVAFYKLMWPWLFVTEEEWVAYQQLCADALVRMWTPWWVAPLPTVCKPR